MPTAEPDVRTAIIDKLMVGYHSHSYAITPAEMIQLGLQLNIRPDIELLAWQISVLLQQDVGGAVRNTPDDSWQDVLLVSRGLAHSRQQAGNGMSRWLEIEVS